MVLIAVNVRGRSKKCPDRSVRAAENRFLGGVDTLVLPSEKHSSRGRADARSPLQFTARRRRVHLVAVAACIALTLASFAAAQQGPIPSSKDPLPSLTSFGAGDLWSSLGRLGLTLVLVVGLIWGTMWLARRVLKGRIAGRGESNLRVMERLYLAPKKSIEVVSVGGRVLVLAVTENRISMLAELAPGDLPATAGAVLGRPAMPRAQEHRQRDLLRQARVRMQELFASTRMTRAESPPSA